MQKLGNWRVQIGECTRQGLNVIPCKSPPPPPLPHFLLIFYQMHPRLPVAYHGYTYRVVYICFSLQILPLRSEWSAVVVSLIIIGCILRTGLYPTKTENDNGDDNINNNNKVYMQFPYILVWTLHT